MIDLPNFFSLLAMTETVKNDGEEQRKWTLALRSRRTPVLYGIPGDMSKSESPMIGAYGGWRAVDQAHRFRSRQQMSTSWDDSGVGSTSRLGFGQF
jgi:hypothetical protein